MLIAAVVTTSLHALPASGVEDPCAGAEKSVEPVQLCGTNTIRGSVPASVVVEVPEDATIGTPFGSSPDFDVEGEGRFAGFVLAPLDASAPTIIGGRFPAENGVEFVLPGTPYSALGGGNWDFLKWYPDDTGVLAGRYRLYLLADGSPVTVTLRLGELDGAVEITPALPAEYHFELPEPRLLGGAGVTKNIYGAGRSGSITGTGLLFHALWLDIEANAAGQYEFCYRAPGGDDMDPIELGPACGAASDFELVNNRDPSPEPDTRLYMNGLDLVPAGRQHLGFWSSSEAVVNDLQYMQFWLSYTT